MREVCLLLHHMVGRAVRVHLVLLMRHGRGPTVMRLMSVWLLAKWRPTKRRLAMRRHVWRWAPRKGFWT